MAHVEKRGPGRWRARYRDPDGRERSRTFDRRIDAERFLDTVRGELVSGSYVDPSAGDITFKEYAEQWRAAQVHRPTTEVQVRSMLSRHVYPYLGEKRIGRVRRSEIQAWVKGRTEVLSPTTVVTVTRWVATIFRAAVDDGLIRSSPVKGVKLPKQERPRVVPLEPEAVQVLIDRIPDRYRAAIVLAASTGLRQGEVFGLTADRIDFLRRSVRVDRQLVTIQGQEPFLAPPKTEASRRQVPLPDVALDALSRHVAEFPPGEAGYVFTTDDGQPIRRGGFSAVWRPAAAAAGIPSGTGMHALRHFYASLLIRYGESVKVVQSRLGHASASETLDTYSHLWPDSEDTTRAAVDAVLNAPAASPRPAAASPG